MRTARFLPASALLLLACAASADAAPAPITPAEQKLISLAIDRGGRYLKAAQNPTGTWPRPGDNHTVGYAALPGLTLLHCGVPPTDPAVKRAALLVRREALRTDATYELALALLFLDRLDDPRDRPLIQALAVRLIAGQTPTGGWGYKCPKLAPETRQRILVLLRQLNPGRPVFVVARPQPGGGPVGLPVGGPAGGAPGLVAGPDGKGPGGVPVGGKGPGGIELADGGKGPGDRGVAVGRPGGPATPAAGPERSVGDDVKSPPTVDGKSTLPRAPGDKKAPDGLPRPEEARRDEAPAPIDLRRWARCLKAVEGVDDSPAPPEPKKPPAKEEAPAARVDDRPAPPAPKPAPLSIVPTSLRGLAVFQPPSAQVLKDLPDRADKPFLSTTDNSNTQFAILALWAAQRHDVPMERSLRLMVRRYQTSQNDNGSWSYHYSFGGGLAEGPAMTAVGLIGLAVGHGLAGKADGQNARDPAIFKGFLALGRHVGNPAGRMWALPQPNLYLLWSIERAAMLYGVSEIAGKDWYRWGAEALVANQDEVGAWNKGGYPGASPVIDTCLALLFLKRVNLAEGLRDRLPFKPADVEAGVRELNAPPPAPTKTAEEIAEEEAAAARRRKRIKDQEEGRKRLEEQALARANPPRDPGLPTRPEGPETSAPPQPSPAPAPASTPAPAQAPSAAKPEDNEGGRGWLRWVILALGAALLAGAAACVVVYQRQKGEPEEKPVRRAAKKRATGARQRRDE